MLANEKDLTVTDREAVLAAAADYIESWLDGDGDRMAGCLHPELVKREVEHDLPDGGPRLDTMSRDEMVDATARGLGQRYARPYDAQILDAFGDIATVRVYSSVYMDYLHVARFRDRWQIVNVLWQRRPGR